MYKYLLNTQLMEEPVDLNSKIKNLILYRRNLVLVTLNFGSCRGLNSLDSSISGGGTS